MVKKARMFRGSVGVVATITILLIYTFPKQPKALQLRKKSSMCPDGTVLQSWKWPLDMFNSCIFSPLSTHAQWNPKNFRWKHEEYNPEETKPIINPMLNKINFDIQIQENLCDSNSSLGLAFVLSSADHFHERNSIRQTWAHPDIHNYTRIRAMFIIGSTENTTLQKDIELESQLFNDILQISTLDSYRNLTYKTMAALTWIKEWCTELPWIVKIDDDVVVNPFNLRKFLELEMKLKPGLSSIYGRVRRNAKPWKMGKWMVTKEEYKGVFYPTFILGSAYIIGRNAVDRLYAHVNYTPFLWLEDVFTTGLLSKKASVNRVSIEKHYFISAYTQGIVRGRAAFYVGADKDRAKSVWNEILHYYQLTNMIDTG